MSQDEQLHQDLQWMRLAMDNAERARTLGEVPVGAVLVEGNQHISDGWNRSISDNDASAHAEVMAIRQAGQVLENYRLINTTLYVTLEPCPMCAGLIIHSRVKRLVFGAFDFKTGCVGSVMNLLTDQRFNHQVEVTGGVLEVECSEQLSSFFRDKRAQKKLIKQSKTK